MIRFVLRRLAGTIPTLIGISLVTFVLLNLSMGSPTSVETDAGWISGVPLGASSDERSRFPDYHLPLFINLSIDDAEDHASNELSRLNDERTAAGARRNIVRAGGAWLPYLLPVLPRLAARQREGLLDALDDFAPRIGLERALSVAADRAAFWKRYWETYGSDFQPVRAARLVRRLIRRDDALATSELLSLDNYCLPQLMEALGEDIPADAKARLVSVVITLTGIEDPLIPTALPEQREAVLKRWREWWSQRYDRYTVFAGAYFITGMFTETRYFRWLSRIVTFDFGMSTRDGRPILTKLLERLPITLLLSVLGLLIAYGIAIPIGIISAVRRGGVFDRSMMVVVFVFYSFPTFWLAMLLLRFLGGAGYLDLFPAQGLFSPLSGEWPLWKRFFDAVHHLFLPVLCLSSVSIAMLARYQRVGMIQVINLDFMRAARAKGLSPTKAILRHGLRNGILPVVTMLGLQIPYLVSGSVVVERIFGIPGMGHETFEAIRAHDQPWLMAMVTVTAIMTLIGVVAADAVYALIDPRIAPGERAGDP